MKKIVRYFQTRLMARLVLVAAVVVVLLSAAYILLQMRNARTASESAIANYGMNLAQSYAKQMDTAPYAKFLTDPKEDDGYWSIRQELDRYRVQIGALYVYLVKINENREPLIMIDGQPKDSDSASPINEVTDIPPDAVDILLNGEPAHSSLLVNEQYGTYISAYAPVKDANGKQIGVLGIDTEASVVDQIAGDIMHDSVPYYLGLGVLTVLALLLLAWYIVRAVRPLQVLVAATESIARGDLVEANATLASKKIDSLDEIGSAYRSTRSMADNLTALMSTITSNVKGTSEQLASSLEVFAQESQQLVKLNQVVSGTVRKVDEGARTQQHSASESARSMEEVTQSIGRVTEAAYQVSEASRQALEAAESGKGTIGHMKRQIGTISDAASESQKLVEELGGFSKQIEEVLRTIVDIADQTKLLALNASIEAARAGEHGSGFAIVAGEVRKLAEVSSSSTGQIAALLKNIRTISAQIGDTMAAGSAEIKEGIELSAQADEAFHSVVTLFRFVTEQIQEISASAEQISAGSQEVAASVGEMADIAKASSAGTHEINEMAQQQLQAAQQIAASANKLSGMSNAMRSAIERISV